MRGNQEVSPSESRARWIDGVTVMVDFMFGDWAEARHRADAALERTDAGSPHVLDPEIRDLRAWMLVAEGDVAKAVEDTEASLAATAGPNAEAQVRAPSLMSAARVFLEAGRREDAEAAFGEALENGDRLGDGVPHAAIVEAARGATDYGPGGEA